MHAYKHLTCVLTNGNAEKSNDIGEDVGPDGFGTRAPPALGKDMYQGEDLILAHTLGGGRKGGCTHKSTGACLLKEDQRQSRVLASNPGLPRPDFISQPWRKIGE